MRIAIYDAVSYSIQHAADAGQLKGSVMTKIGLGLTVVVIATTGCDKRTEKSRCQRRKESGDDNLSQ